MAGARGIDVSKCSWCIFMQTYGSYLLPLAKRVLARNLSSENEFDLHEN